MSTALTAAQGLGVLAVMLGVALLLPLGWALVADGLIVVAVAVAAEVAVSRALKAPSDRRSGIKKPGGA